MDRINNRTNKKTNNRYRKHLSEIKTVCLPRWDEIKYIYFLINSD